MERLSMIAKANQPRASLKPTDNHRPRRAAKPNAEPVNAATVEYEVKPRSRWPPTFGTEPTEYDALDKTGETEAWKSAYDSIEEAPDGYWVENVEGEIPKDIHGTYFRNGPGDFNFLNEPVVFSFDANGILGSIAIKDGKAFFRSKYVDTEHSMLEEKAGRRLFKGIFGTQPKGGSLPFTTFVNRNAGNGKPVPANGRLLVPQEGSPLTEVDPYTLETVYPRVDGSLLASALRVGAQQLYWTGNGSTGSSWESSNGSPFLDPKTVLGFGDSKYDGRRNVSICHCYSPKPRLASPFLETEVTIYELDLNFRIRGKQTHIIDSFSMVHSIGVSENYYVINRFPATIDIEKIINPRYGIGSCVKFDDAGIHEFHLVPRPAPDGSIDPFKKTIKIRMEDSTFPFHFVNAYEEDGNVIVDAIHFDTYPINDYAADDPNFLDSYDPDKTPRPKWRRTICSMNGRVEFREICPRNVEMPAINPKYIGRHYKYAYLLSGIHPTDYSEPRLLTQVNLETGEMRVWGKGSDYFCGEPIFVPRDDAVEEDDGYVMSFCYSGKTKKTEFVILDAQKFEEGPVATLYLDHSVAHGFHGIWSGEYYGA